MWGRCDQVTYPTTHSILPIGKTKFGSRQACRSGFVVPQKGITRHKDVFTEKGYKSDTQLTNSRNNCVALFLHIDSFSIIHGTLISSPSRCENSCWINPVKDIRTQHQATVCRLGQCKPSQGKCSGNVLSNLMCIFPYKLCSTAKSAPQKVDNGVH